MEKAAEKEKYADSPVTLDEKDRLILKLLQQNAKITVREIAAAIHLSTTPVHERIKRMEDNGVILQYATLVNHSKVKKGLMVICYISLKEHNKKSGAKFIKTINELNEVIECYNISGEYDFMLKVVVESMDAYYDFHVNKLGQLENVGHMQSTFVMGVIKQTHLVV
jgi:Lrp/AsnC family transcriptional regulator, leucine-responsive regulatory protein